jgi:acyl carrier protein
MTGNEILEQLQGIFHDVFDDDSLIIIRDTCADDIEDWDSLAQINLIVAIEKEFKAKFSLVELLTLSNVGDMVDLIMSKVA